MTFGHFTSWHADDRGYYTGVEYTPAYAPHGAFVPYDIHSTERERERERARERAMIRSDKIVGHIFGATYWAYGIHKYMCYIC